MPQSIENFSATLLERMTPVLDRGVVKREKVAEKRSIYIPDDKKGGSDNLHNRTRALKAEAGLSNPF